MRKIRIRYKIIVPFLALFQGVLFVVYYQFNALLLTQIETQVRNQMIDVAYTLGQTHYHLRNPQILEKVKRLLHADIILCDAQFFPISGTLTEAKMQQLQFFLKHSQKNSIFLNKENPFLFAREVPLTEKKYAVVVAEIPEKSFKGFICLIYPEERFLDPQQKSAQTLKQITQLSTILVIVVGIIISLTITRPLERLSREAKQITSMQRQAHLNFSGNDEVGELAVAFNQTLEKLKQAQEELLRAERLATLGKITARIAHEIRNPLTSIRMIIQNAKRRVEQQQLPQESSLQMVLQELDRLALIVQELLSFGNPTELRKKTFVLPPLIDEVLQLLQPRLQHLKIQFICDYSPTLPAVNADADKIKQVFLNLILNAIQAMPQGGTLTLKVEPLPEKKLKIRIQDTGVGVSPEAEQNLFHSFFTTRSDGTGLGLTTTQEIIQQHQGEIGFCRLTQGSEFWFTLPFALTQEIAEG